MYVIGIIAILSFASCDSGKFQESEDGYTYKIVRDADGPMPQDGSFIQYNFEYKDENDSMIIDSKEYNSPVIIQCQTATWENSGPLYKALNLIGEGDSAIFRIPTKSLFEESFRNQVPDGVNPEGTITVYIGVENIMMQEEFEQMLADRSSVQLEKDVAQIEEYLDKNNLEAQSTESGLRYTILEEGSGEAPQPGDMVKVHYRGTLLDGTEFDSSYGRDEPFSFNVGQGNVIRGWDEGVPLLKEGGKAVFYIPSTLAYGERGAGGIIEPNTVLKFEVELLEIE
jgi:FKBP-type peptidyl-prolyl cis-trans isomerase